ncbi:MAG: TIGR01212 family radical SAM protein [Oscillospiraceae bacterium]|nr:TIGR01212 family radical SAM protein [Oscillospiraceae bacterium]
MKHYYSINEYLRNEFGCKVYKLSLDGGFTCPNRDGTLDSRGCIFCSGRGSGEFSVASGQDVAAALQRAKGFVRQKAPDCRYIAYFQSFTGTYAPVEKLEKLYTAAIAPEEIVALSVATRPDCIPGEELELLCRINRIKPVWVELGLQSIHESSAEYIRRGYELPVFDDALRRLKNAGLQVIVHMIIGLPGETEQMIYDTALYIGQSGADGVKFQLLHVLEGTDLAEDYRRGLFEALSLEKYTRLLAGCIKRIPPEMVVHRLTGDGDKKLLIAPLWSGDKKRVLNYVNRYFDDTGLIQGSLLI